MSQEERQIMKAAIEGLASSLEQTAEALRVLGDGQVSVFVEHMADVDSPEAAAVQKALIDVGRSTAAMGDRCLVAAAVLSTHAEQLAAQFAVADAGG